MGPWFGGPSAERQRSTTGACPGALSAHIGLVLTPHFEKILVQIRTLGGLRQTSGGTARPLRRKPLALLSYLARRGPRAVTRTELATLFWGERGEDRARQSLRQALLELKQSLGDRIEVDADTVRVVGDAVDLDIVGFERDLSAGRVLEAVGRWTGDFFEGAEDIGGDGFRRWIENERLSLHQQLGAAMGKLIGDAELAGDWAGAAAWAQRWAAALPFEEQAHLRLIEALRMSGRTGDALETHAAFVTRVRTSLDIEPSSEFLRLGGGLAEGARDELARRGRGSAAVRAPALVGRGQVMTELMDAWKSAVDGKPVVVFIEGAAGCGLTRTCDEVMARVSDEAVVLHARAGGATHDLATAAELFDGIRSAEGSAGASPEALAEVARLVPGLTTQFRHLPTASGDDASLRDGLAQTIASIDEEKPVLLVLDDAHAADDASRRLIASLAPRLTGGVMLLLAADEGEREPGPALSALLATRGLRQLRLTELSAADVEAMLESMVTLDSADRHQLAVRLHAETGGSPHDVRELVTSLVDDHLLTLDTSGAWRPSPALAGRPLPMPPAVRERMRARLDRLSPAARALVDAMAVLGSPADASVAEAIAELSPDDLQRASGELLARRIVYEVATPTGQFEFPSPLAARITAALLPATKREALHARAAQVLSERDLAVTAERSLLPYHLARAPRPAEPDLATRPPARSWKSLRILVPAAAVALVAAIAMRRDLPFALSSKAGTAVPIVALGRIADYRENPTSNLTKPLTDMLATNLGRVPRLRVVSAARMYELVNQARAGDTTDGALVSAARRAGATELVDGALYARDDGGYRLDLRRVELETGRIKNTYSIAGTTLFELADSGTARVAADFGESTPPGSIADVTTRSLAAYRFYEEGLRAYYANDRRTAEPLFEAALREDSTFAMAAYYSALSVVSAVHVALERYALAERLAKRASDRERLTILSHFAFLSSSPTMLPLAETLSVRYPDEVEGYYFTGLGLMMDGQLINALAPFRRVVAMDSLAFNGSRASCLACDAMRQIVNLYQMSDSAPAAEREVRRWIRLQPRSPVPWNSLADLMSHNSRPAEALVALDRAATFDAGRREAERLLTLAVHRIHAGDFEQADRLLAGELESGSPFRAGTAQWYRSISFRNQGRLAEAIAAGQRGREMALANNYPKNAAAGLRAVPTEAVAVAQSLHEMGRYRAAAAIFDSVSRWVVATESPSQRAHSRAWQMTHATASMIAGGDTASVPARIDTIRALGAQSGLARDRNLHHHVRGLLLAARGQDEAAITEFRRAIGSLTFGYTRTNMAMAAALLRQRRPQEAIAVLQPALRGSIEASNFYVSRTEIHELLGQAWSEMSGEAARDSAAAHYAFVTKAWSRADSIFAPRLQRAIAGSRK